MKKSVFALALAVMSMASTARAQDPESTRITEDSKWQLSLRSGFALPVGRVSDGGAVLENRYDGSIPIWLDVGYRFGENIVAGVYFQWGYAFPRDCPGGDATCDGYNLRTGIEGFYHFMPDRKIDPWLGVGIGYELQHATLGSTDYYLQGIEYLTLQVGADRKIGTRFSVGPYASISLSQYLSEDTGTGFRDIEDGAAHSWLQFGIKGSFDL
jgi:outer membrane protein W